MNDSKDKTKTHTKKLSKKKNIISMHKNSKPKRDFDNSKEETTGEFDGNEKISPNIINIFQKLKKKYFNKKIKEKNNLRANLQMDKPTNIKHVKIINNNICFLVEWKERPDGIHPEESYVSNECFKRKFPMFLIKYYESKIKLVNKKQNKILFINLLYRYL